MNRRELAIKNCGIVKSLAVFVPEQIDGEGLKPLSNIRQN
jgi:hypothetical protein